MVNQILQLSVITESGSDSTMIVPMDSNNTHYSKSTLEWVKSETV